MKVYYRRHGYRNRFGHRSGRLWTEEEDARLAQLWEDGVTISQIAIDLNRERDAIPHRLIKIGIDITKPRVAKPESNRAYDRNSKSENVSGDSKKTSIVLLIIILAVIAAFLYNSSNKPIPTANSSVQTSTVQTAVANTSVHKTAFYTAMASKGNYLIFLTCSGNLCSFQKMNETLQAQSGLLPASNSSIPLVLMQQQEMENIYGFGINGSAILNAGELASGSLKDIFHTPIQLLAFNLTLKGIAASGGATGEYYNPTTSNNTEPLSLNETILATKQASYIFITQAKATPDIGVVGSVYGEEYFVNKTLT